MDHFLSLLGLASLVLVPQLHAINDIPEGELLWLQGFDGNPPTPGFRVDGTLLLRSVDDISNIGVNLSSGAITNSPTGTIRFEVGVTGARFISGSVFNQGQFKVDSGTDFTGANTQFLNTGRFTVGESFVARFYGQGSHFTQQEGSLEIGNQGFEFYDGTFAYTGGEIIGRPLFSRSQVLYAAADEAPFQPHLIGPGGGFRGPLGTNLHLRILGASGQGGDTAVTLEDSGDLLGNLEIGQYYGGSSVRITPASGSLNIAPSGTLTVTPNGGANSTLAGNLANDGTIRLSAALAVANANGVATNRANLTFLSGGNLQFEGGFRQEAGELKLNGTSMGAAKGVTIAGPGTRLNGNVRAAVTNETVLYLSQNEGELAVAGSFANQPGATLNLELSEGELGNPLLSTTGVLAAGGALTVTLIPGFEPQLGESFPLFTMQAVTGRFRPFRLPTLPPGLFWELLKSPSQWGLVVRNRAPVPQLRLTLKAGVPTIEISGTPGRSATIYGTVDLKTWEVIQSQEPFSGEFSVETPMLPGGSPVFFRGEIEQ